jgi:hypothetical protein
VPSGFADGVDNDTTYVAGAGLDLAGNQFSIPAGGVTTSMIGDNQVTPAKVPNRTRRFAIAGNQFLSNSNTSAFDLGNGTAAANRRNRVTSFAGDDTAGLLTTSFVVPADYVGPTAAELASNPGLQVPRLTIRWATNSTQPNGSRKANIDVMFSQDDQLVVSSLANRFRYNIRANAGASTDAAESLDPSNAQIATQVIPEANEIWSTGTANSDPLLPWAPGQVIVLTLYRNAADGNDPNSARVGIVSVGFEYEADQ